MKILLSGGSGIGDLMFALPVAAALKEKFPKSKIGFLIGGTDDSKKILSKILNNQKNSYIDEIYYYNSKELLHCLKLLLKLKAERYSYGLFMRYINQPFSWWPIRIFKFIGCKTVALKGYVPDNAPIDYFIQNINKKIHNVDAYFALLEYFNIQNNNTNKYYFNLFDIDKLRSKYKTLMLHTNNEKILCFCVGANSVKRKVNGIYRENDIKIWPIQKWIELANILSNEGYSVILVGGSKERQMIDRYIQHLNKKVINVVGMTDIEDSLAILSSSDLVIGCDTGLMHCAAALNVYTLMLLGAVDPIQAQGYGDRSYSIYLCKSCSPCYGTGRDLQCKNYECMCEISVTLVYEKIKKILK